MDAPAREDLPAVAEAVHGDPLMGNCPPGYDPSVDDLLTVLQAAW
ncbi:MAG: hypothetical protein ABEJ42_00755 [Halobacteriaceae archaeon]